MRKADNLPSSCAVVEKSESLNFLESSGPIQACNGTALPFLQFTLIVEANLMEYQKLCLGLKTAFLHHMVGLMCRKIQQLRRHSLRTGLTSAETRRCISYTVTWCMRSGALNLELIKLWTMLQLIHLS